MTLDRLRRLAACIAMTGLLAACDQTRIEQLEEGVSTEADVKRQFGEPASVRTLDDGSRVFEYPRQPEGWSNYFITIGQDGKMRALRQVLTPTNFAKVQPGMGKTEVQQILGRPARSQTYPLKPDEEHWEWHYRENQTPMVFTVTFEPGGQVKATSKAEDPRHTMPGGK